MITQSVIAIIAEGIIRYGDQSLSAVARVITKRKEVSIEQAIKEASSVALQKYFIVNADGTITRKLSIIPPHCDVAFINYEHLFDHIKEERLC